MMPKICVECKHYDTDIDYKYGQIIDKPICNRDSEVNLVTGWKIGGVCAYVQRAKVSTVSDRCGVNGIYWESKDAK